MKKVNDLRGQARTFPHDWDLATASRGETAGTKSVGRCTHIWFVHGDEGSQLVEFALVLPVFMLLIMGLFSISMAVMTFDELEQTASVAAQQLAVAMTVADPCSNVEQAVVAALPSSINAANISYIVTVTDQNLVAHTYTGSGAGFTCKAAAAEMYANEPVSVEITYPYTWLPIYLLNFGKKNLTGYFSVPASS